VSIPATREAMIDLLEQVAESLSGEWDLKPYPVDWNWGGELSAAGSGAILNVAPASYRDASRIVVRGDLPSDSKKQKPHVLSHDQQMPSITVSTVKTPHQIAQDVERRLMPRYLPLLEKASSMVSSYNTHYTRTQSTVQEIARLLRVKVGPDDERVSFYHSPLPLFSENLGEAKVSGDDVTLELRLDRESALRVLAMLADPSFK
jgi:hypothetical protein